MLKKGVVIVVCVETKSMRYFMILWRVLNSTNINEVVISAIRQPTILRDFSNSEVTESLNEIFY